MVNRHLIFSFWGGHGVVRRASHFVPTLGGARHVPIQDLTISLKIHTLSCGSEGTAARHAEILTW
jgi:hypothetical protein